VQGEGGCEESSEWSEVIDVRGRCIELECRRQNTNVALRLLLLIGILLRIGGLARADGERGFGDGVDARIGGLDPLVALGLVLALVHAALRAQNDPLFTEPYAWRSKLWPLAPIWSLTVSTMLLACCLAAGIKPLGGGSFTANNFFLYVIGILIIGVFTLAYKVFFRTAWVDPKTADLVTGRRTLTVDEIAQLDAYYAMPTWRRVLTYLELW